ncbi:MAG TPA: ATP-binding protein [bacterium]|nr:ATP-binding protein [bacterium]HOM27633.1 ATP-binding protein [bacterium]
MEKIKDILLLQKREIERKFEERFIERDIDKRKFENDLIKVIIGPRRAGKSFFGIHFLKEKGDFGYINFEDERIINIKNYDDLINALKIVYRKPKILFFDEIQNIGNWEIFVNRLQREGFNIILTGSNSKLLGRDLSTHLTGRHISVFVFPFSFQEFLRIEGKELTTSEIKSKLIQYINFGGFPEPHIKKIDFKDYLSMLFNSLIYKDIVKRYRIRKPDVIENLAIYLISNTGKEFSYNTLSKITGARSVHTIERYIDYLEEGFLIFRVNKFSFKLKQMITSNKKIYCIDNGFIYTCSLKATEDTGFLYENAVAVELKRYEMEGKIKLYYWKNEKGEEIDFVVRKGTDTISLIQVAYEISDIKTKKREIRALLKGKEELRCENLIILNNEYKAEEEIKWFGIKGRVKFIPFWEWFIERNKF